MILNLYIDKEFLIKSFLKGSYGMRKILNFGFVLVLTFAILTACSSKKTSNETVKLKSNGKFVVLIFDSTTCPYCKKLHMDLKNNEQLKEEEKKTVIYTIHVNETRTYILPTQKGNLKLQTDDLAQMYGFRGSTPFIVFCDKNFRPILTIPGYLKPKTLSKVFKYITSRAYETMSINEYLSTP